MVPSGRGWSASQSASVAILKVHSDKLGSDGHSLNGTATKVQPASKSNNFRLIKKTLKNDKNNKIN